MQIKKWTPGNEVPISEMVAIDTETELIKDHTPPPVVTLQAYIGDGMPCFVHYPHIPEFLKDVAKWNPKSHFVFHNAPFDLPVLGNPEFLLKAADESRLHDTMVHYPLHRIAEHGFLTRRALDYCCEDILGRKLDKNEDVRLTFTRDMPIDDVHVEYACTDAVATYDLRNALTDCPTEPTHTRGALALDDISRRGLRVDVAEQNRLIKIQKDVQEKALEILADHEYIPGREGNKKVMQNILQGIARKYGIKLEKTAKSGDFSVSKKALKKLGNVEIPFLKALQMQAHAAKMISTYMNPKYIGVDGRVHTRYGIITSGRPNSKEPCVLNLPRKENIRGQYIPTEGHIIAAVDYNQLELCTLAQTCIHRFGKSRMAEVINEGLDLHKYLASFIYGIPMDSVNDTQRQYAKVASLGYPGGLSAGTFIDYAAGYDVILNLDESKFIRDKWLQAFPEMNDHLKPSYDSETETYFSILPTGRMRSHCAFTEAANDQMQGLAAEGFKEAIWLMYRKKIPMINAIYDETLTELPDTDIKIVREKVKEIEKLMIAGMKKVVPDVAIRVESTLMDRWLKTKPQYDETGLIVIRTNKP